MHLLNSAQLLRLIKCESLKLLKLYFKKLKTFEAFKKAFFSGERWCFFFKLKKKIVKAANDTFKVQVVFVSKCFWHVLVASDSNFPKQFLLNFFPAEDSERHLLLFHSFYFVYCDAMWCKFIKMSFSFIVLHSWRRNCPKCSIR